MITAYFSRDENAGGPGMLSVWNRGPTIRVNNRDAAGPLVPVPGIQGNVAPLIDEDLDITDSAGRRVEGHIQVFTIGEKLKLDSETTGQHSMFVLHKGHYYFLEEVSDWPYAKGFVYRGTLDRRQDGI